MEFESKHSKTQHFDWAFSMSGGQTRALNRNPRIAKQEPSGGWVALAFSLCSPMFNFGALLYVILQSRKSDGRGKKKTHWLAVDLQGTPPSPQKDKMEMLDRGVWVPGSYSSKTSNESERFSTKITLGSWCLFNL